MNTIEATEKMTTKLAMVASSARVVRQDIEATLEMRQKLDGSAGFAVPSVEMFFKMIEHGKLESGD